jgi:AraC-like DNA-binding protein
MCISRLLVSAVVSELGHRGIDPHAIVDGLDELLINTMDLSPGLGPRQIEVAIERLCAHVRDPGFGLVLGQETPETMLNVVGLLMLSCATMRQRFEVFERYASLFIQGIDWRLEERVDSAVFGFSLPPLAEHAARFIADWILVFALRVGQSQLRDQRLPPTELRLAHPAPSYAQRYTGIFGCAVRFDQADYGIVFSPGITDRPQAHPDPVAGAALREVAEGLYREATGASSFVARVQHRLRELPSLAEVDLEGLARQLGMSPRSLRRRLREEGATLYQLLEEARCHRARRELAIYDERIDAIAERLGYTEISSFHRAFKRWTGQTPFEYRQQTRSTQRRK